MTTQEFSRRRVPAKRSRTSPRSAPEEPTGIALWRQVADALEGSIAAGVYRAGAKLPGENEIAELFSVNRHTVRRALAVLADRGLVLAERGSGTYVQPQRIAYPIGLRTRFSQIVGTSGREAGGRLIASATEQANSGIASRLGIKVGASVVRLELLRQADRVPICIATTWLPAARFSDAARVYGATASITRTLGHFGVSDYRRAHTRITAASAGTADALRLQLKPGSPILLVDSIDVDAANRPVLATHARFAAGRIEFVVES